MATTTSIPLFNNKLVVFFDNGSKLSVLRLANGRYCAQGFEHFYAGSFSDLCSILSDLAIKRGGINRCWIPPDVARKRPNWTTGDY